jgi:hypothetical protein
MLRSELYKVFAEVTPTTVMARALLENVLSEKRLNELFQRQARRQRSGETLFSTIVDLMSLVVLREKPSLHAAYQLRLEEMCVSIQSIYDKVDGLETQVSEALVRETAQSFRELLALQGSALESPIPGYRVRILDGNHLAGTEHRLKELRGLGAAALPGQTLALLDPTTQLVTDIICEEDGHAHERTLLPRVYECLQPGEVVIADRCFASFKNVRALSERRIHFILRQHANNLPVEELEPPKYRGRVEGGTLYEQRVKVVTADGWERELRRITVRLVRPSRFGDKEIHLITDLPPKVQARVIQQGYRKRWTIESCFQKLTVTLKCELNTLGYPKAALFGFSVAAVMYNLLAAIQGTLRACHDRETIEREFSLFYLAEETSSLYHGMMVALPAKNWKKTFGAMPLAELVTELQRLARKVKLKRFRKHPRGPKKPPPKRKSGHRGNHVATSQLLAQRVS